MLFVLVQESLLESWANTRVEGYAYATDGQDATSTNGLGFVGEPPDQQHRRLRVPGFPATTFRLSLQRLVLRDGG